MSKVAVQELGTNPISIGIGLLTTIVVVLVASYSTKIIRRFAILVGTVIGYGAYLYLGNLYKLVPPIDYSQVCRAAWLGLPTFQTPVFDPTAISLIAPVAIILIAENLGHVKAIGGMTRRNLDPYLWRAFVGDGVATMVSAAGGGTGVTTYAENMGVMRITNNFSSMTMVIAALIAIALGLSPKFGALIHTIPAPVLGGLSFVMFGIISATAGSIWQQGIQDGTVNFGEMRTLFVVGVALIMGAGDFTITVGKFALGGIITATLSAIVLYHVTRWAPREESETPIPVEPTENAH